MTKTEIFIEKSKIIHLDKYDYSNTIYINNYSKVEIICKEHGSFFQKPLYHSAHGCPKCGRIRMKNSKIDNSNKWLEDFIKVHKDRYDYSKVIYTGAKNKVEIVCREHDSFFQRVMDHKSGSGCKKCGELKSRTTGIKSSMIAKRNLISDFIKVHNDRYDYSKVIYTTKKSKVEIICKKHGSFLQTTSSHKSGSGCPDCKISKGESRIMNILNDFSINFKSQYRFDDCRLIYPLVFDFYLPDYNMCVEYDGIQHFEPIEKWGGIERFQKQIVNDNIKNKYCIENNIKLLRIPYTNFDKIESILDNI
jgi:Zn finger protein HypA/HybF involved in hydrogenase expression/very-short-patch-repair endonuclease